MREFEKVTKKSGVFENRRQRQNSLPGTQYD